MRGARTPLEVLVEAEVLPLLDAEIAHHRTTLRLAIAAVAAGLGALVVAGYALTSAALSAPGAGALLALGVGAGGLGWLALIAAMHVERAHVCFDPHAYLAARLAEVAPHLRSGRGAPG